MRRPPKVLIALLGVVGLTAQGSVGHSMGVENPWNLDRINQTALPLDGNASMGALTGAGIDIYIVDTGVRPTHEQLNGRVFPGVDVAAINMYSEVDPPTSDCDGHGTHVAATAAGTTTGVAVQANIISVRVLDCNGNAEVEDVVDGLKWVLGHHVSGRMAIANLSLGVDVGDDGTTIIEMVHELIADGVIVVVAAGNGDESGKPLDACRIAPGSDPQSLTVGATTKTDGQAFYSNYGPCVDIWAPGGDRTTAVNSAWMRSDTDYMGDIGTSMAAPHVAGVLALLGQQQPSLCPTQYVDAVLERATKNAIVGLDGTSANRLLNVNTSPITSLYSPGRPSNVIITPDSSSMIVGWESPCDGGSPIVSTRISVLHAGKVVKSTTVAPGRNAVRFRGLVPGRQYSVVIKSTNAVGPGAATSRITAPRIASLKVGRAIRVDNLVRGESDDSTKLRSLTPSRCVVRGQERHRLVGMRAGTCRYAILTNGARSEIIRTIVVAR